MKYVMPKEAKDLIDRIFERNAFKIVTLGGDHGVGKDLYASMISKMTGCPVRRFADPLREDFKDYGINEETLDILKRTELTFKDPTIIGGYNVEGMTTREAMVHIAETNKKTQPDFYSSWMKSEIELANDNGPGIVIPDLRFDVEGEMIRNYVTENEGWALWIHLVVGRDLPVLTVI